MTTTRPYPLWHTESPATLLASRVRRTGECIFPAVADNSPLSAEHEPVPAASVMLR